mmetsp:Transcript_34637/g.49172  ORF Transcript_34637/g.49172 Transcript_34637/m.49172 type:complete len:231 (-) Transcript_34637:145-837(-)
MLRKPGGASRLSQRRNASPVNTISADYSVAIATLNEDSMTQACMLLQSQEYSEEAYSDELSQLLELFNKCCEATSKIEEHTKTLTLAPPGTMAAPLRKKGSGVQQQPQSKALSRRTSLKQIGRTTRSTKPGASASMKPQIPPSTVLKREPSDSSAASTNSSTTSGKSNLVANKKARLMGDHKQGGGTAPPPAALSFLEKLNSSQKAQQKGAMRGMAAGKGNVKRTSRRLG